MPTSRTWPESINGLLIAVEHFAPNLCADCKHGLRMIQSIESERRMLLKVLDKAASFLESEDLDVDVEYEAPFISQFPISGVEIGDDALLVRLGIKHTACLAEDRCLPPISAEADFV
jgi:hypothetical protein